MAASVTKTIAYNTGTAASFTYNGALISFGLTAAQLINVPPYDTTNPTIVENTGVLTDEVQSFEATTTATGSDAAKFVLNADGTDYYWTGTTWALSVAYAQSNTATEINDNLDEFTVVVLAGSAKTVKVKVYLHSGTGASTPTVSQVEMVYNFAAVAPSVPDTCIVYGWVLNAADQPVAGVEVRVKNNGFYHGSYWVDPMDIPITTDTDGFWAVALAETESVNLKPYVINIGSSNRGEFADLQVPAIASVQLDELINQRSDDPSFTDMTDQEVASYNFIIQRGSTFLRTIEVLDSGGAPVDLTGVSARMQIRVSQYARDFMLELTSSGGDITFDAPNGLIYLTIDESVTEDLFSGGVYDIELVDYPSAGDVKRILEGSVKMAKEVTR